MKIIVTGAAGFIGSAVAARLLKEGHQVLGIDSHNAYYDPMLKESRLSHLLALHPSYSHSRTDIVDLPSLSNLFTNFNPEIVINLAAQAGVRYSMENPSAYVQSNLVGFGNILECCRLFNVKHLLYASSSSVYGVGTNLPYSTDVPADFPISLYAATKRSNELLAHSYSHIYSLPTTGLRFFTVYGPWGRPDMALFKFVEHIINDKTISLYNMGNHYRDFTYIDDVVDCVLAIAYQPLDSLNSSNNISANSSGCWSVYNIGNSSPVLLTDFLKAIESALSKSARVEFCPMQSGDVKDTYADMTNFRNRFHFQPNTDISIGVQRFVNWYLNYFPKTQSTLR